jgi:hypothetical protein
MGTTPNFGWTYPPATNYVKDLPTDLGDLADEIDATVAALPAGALELVQTQTLTTSTGVSFTGLSVGTRYKYIWRGYTSADNVAVNIRFRENSTDKATTYYGGQVGYGYDGTNYAAARNNVTTINGIETGGSTQSYYSQITGEYIIWAANAASTIFQAQTHYSPFFKVVGISNAAMTNCNGISIYPASGTFTGSISLFKYNV